MHCKFPGLVSEPAQRILPLLYSHNVESPSAMLAWQGKETDDRKVEEKEERSLKKKTKTTNQHAASC